MSNVEFQLPDIDCQKLIVEESEKLEKMRVKLESLLSKCNNVLN